MAKRTFTAAEVAELITNGESVDSDGENSSGETSMSDPDWASSGNDSASDDEKVKGHNVTEDTISVILESSDAASVHVSHNTVSNFEKN